VCNTCNPKIFTSIVEEFWSRRSLLKGAVAVPLAATLIPRAAFGQAQTLQSVEDSAAAQGLKSPLPATIYVAKRIITMERAAPTATAVAVEGDKIAAVGELDGVKEAVAGRQITIDDRFAGKVIMPGFIEHHIHPLLGAMTMSAEVIAIEDWAIPGRYSKAATSNEEYVARLNQALAALAGKPRDETLFTWGYHQYFHGLIRRPQLDEISPNRPMVVWHRSAHEFILNTAALNKYGVTEQSLKGHGLASEQCSFADGHCFESGIELIVPAFAKDLMTPERLKAGLNTVKAYLHSNGVTTIAEPGALVTPQIYQFFAEQLNVDEVPFRTFFIPNGHGLYGKLKQENRLADLIQETKTFDSWGKGKVQWLPNQTKLFCDGAIFSQLMQLKDGYTDGHQGQWIAVPDDYRAAVKAYWDAGYQIHTHVNGDAGLDVVLGALEEQMQANPRQDHRFTVVHFGVSEDDQVDRIARSGAVVSANPYYVSSLADKYSEIGLGPERANTMVRLGSCVERGLHVALHSDMPMAPAFPLLLAWCAANRTTASGRTAAPDQRIPVEKALEGITIEHAYINRLEDMIGSIKPGKKADFTILEQDPLSVAPQDLKDVQVWGTVFEGRVFPVAAPT